MTTDAVGNVLRPPGRSGKGPTVDDEILASYAGFTQKGLTLITGSNSVGTFLPTGTVLKVSGTAKKYTGAAKADVGSPNNLVGILRKDVDTSAGDMLANYLLHGVLKGSKIKYTDDTDGLSVAELRTLAAALGGSYNVVHDTLSY